VHGRTCNLSSCDSQNPGYTKNAILWAQVWRNIYLRATTLLSSVPTFRALGTSLGMEPHGSVSHCKVHMLPAHKSALHMAQYSLLSQFKPVSLCVPKLHYPVCICPPYRLEPCGSILGPVNLSCYLFFCMRPMISSEARTMQTSVSQRPLTARRRPHMRTADYGQAGPAYRHGVTSDTIPARRLSGTLATQHSGASSVPAFRTAANQSQQSSQLVDPGQASHQRMPYQRDAAAASSSQSSLLVESAPQQGSSSSLARQQSTGPVWQFSARNVCRDQGPGCAGQKAPLSPRGSLQAVSEQVNRQESGKSMGSNQGYGRPGQTQYAAASSVMYVKPPWAFDDPYQVPFHLFLEA